MWYMRLFACLLLLALGCKAAHAPPRPPPLPRATWGCTSLVQYRMSPHFSPEDAEAIEEAMALWHTGTWGSACFVSSQAPGALLVLPAPTRKSLAQYTPVWHNVIGLYVASKPAIFIVAGAPVFSVAVHELGHAMGIQHQPNWWETSFMHPEEVPGNTPAPGKLPYADLRAFCVLHGC